MSEFLNSRAIEQIRGRASVKAPRVSKNTVTEQQRDLNRLLRHVDELEGLLDETDDMDFFGTQGWRYRAGIDNN